MNKCDICGRRMYWFQDIVMTTDEFGYITIPVCHHKCSIKQNGKPYYSKNDAKCVTSEVKNGT